MKKIEPSLIKIPTLSWQKRSDQMTLCIDKLDKNAKLGFEEDKDQYVTHNKRVYHNLYDQQDYMTKQTI